MILTAYQNNDPNRLNEINVGILPDAAYLDTQSETIKKGGTVENTVSYELDDRTMPETLVAEDESYGTG